MVLKRIQRSIKIGGRVLIQLGGNGNVREILKVADEINNEKNGVNYFFRFRISIWILRA
jgi:hypothetical protein